MPRPAPALLAPLALAALLCATPPAPAADESTALRHDPAFENILLERFAGMTDRSSRNGLSAYDTLAPVPGTADWRPLPQRPPQQRRLDAQAVAEAIAYAEANNSSALLVWVDGALEIERYFGGSDATTLVNGKSLAKPLSVIALGRAIQAGFIEALDQPVADFIAPWRGTPKAAMTLRQLVGNRSGLLPQGAMPSPGHVMSRAYLHPAHDEVLIHEYPLVDAPGSRYEYSNANSELVAPVIERATGTQYEDWLSREVFAALGARGGDIWMNRPGGTPHAGCCILLPPETYLRLALLLLNDGVWEGRRLLPEGYVDQVRTPSAQNSHAGLGVYIGSPYLERRGPLNPDRDIGRIFHSEPYLADDLFLFDGNSNQVAFIVPSARTVILRTGAWAPPEPEWDNARLPNLVLRALRD